MTTDLAYAFRNPRQELEARGARRAPRADAGGRRVAPGAFSPAG